MHQRHLQSASKRRRGMRGAVIVEGLIVSSLFITILICAVALHRLFTTQVRMAEEAHLATWGPSLRGCGQAPGLGSLTGMVKNSVDADEPDLSGAGAEGWMAMSKRADSRSQSVEVVGQVQEVSSRRSVVCNEPSPGDLGAGSLLNGIAGLIVRD